MWKLALCLSALAALAIFLTYGELVMLGAIVAMILLHELTHWFVARFFGYDAPVFFIGFGSSPCYTLGTVWGTEFRITPWLLGGYVHVDPASEQFRKREAWRRLTVILSGIMVNLAVAGVLMFGLFVSQGERVSVSEQVSVQRIVSPSGPAASAGLVAGDVIETVDGVKVVSYTQLHARMLLHKDGSAAALVVVRDGKQLTVMLHPDSRGYIGMTLHFQAVTVQHKLSIADAFERSIQVIGDMVNQLIVGVFMVLHLVKVTAGSPAGSGAAHGLLSMVQLGGLAFKQGVYSFINEVAFFSVNLAFFSLLPIPGFDGGHLLYLGYEKVTGKTVPEWIQVKLAKITLIIVVLVMAYALFNDILHPVV